MSRGICVFGESGSGKSSSLRTLNPEETYIFDCDGKGLPWKGWRDQYSRELKNYYISDDQNEILDMIDGISQMRPNIKNIVIDTLNSIMIADERRRSKEKSYDKWADLAWAVYDIVKKASSCRDDMNIIMMAHVQTDTDELTGERFSRILTNGKKLNKIGLEKYLTTVLFAKIIEDEYVFLTRDSNSTCKTPFGAFADEKIPNDMAAVLKVLEAY